MQLTQSLVSCQVLNSSIFKFYIDRFKKHDQDKIFCHISQPWSKMEVVSKAVTITAILLYCANDKLTAGAGNQPPQLLCSCFSFFHGPRPILFSFWSLQSPTTGKALVWYLILIIFCIFILFIYLYKILINISVTDLRLGLTLKTVLQRTIFPLKQAVVHDYNPSRGPLIQNGNWCYFSIFQKILNKIDKSVFCVLIHLLFTSKTTVIVFWLIKLMAAILTLSLPIINCVIEPCVKSWAKEVHKMVDRWFTNMIWRGLCFVPSI